jgi:thymidylate synthase ThyX
MGDVFTEEEKQVLGPFVSNFDKPVFVLRNLPEVIKGALFSRYSRSTKGLRRLLIDEFIKGSDSGFSDLVQTQDSGLFNVKKAQDFYDRILDGYGDDSIGELGGAHLAFENISILATKVLEDARIGGSPLEKSTRYVYFDTKVDGDYMFYKEPVIMESRYADLYLEMNRTLFSTYSKLIDPMMDYLKEHYPKQDNVPESAYKFTLRAKACDALRALLPASTLTNMGIFGNGRFFENLIIKMRNEELSEMQNIAQNMQEELDVTIPSFVRRGSPSNQFYKPYEEFIWKTRENVKKLATQKTAGIEIKQSEESILVDYDTDAEEKAIAAILYPQSNLSLHQLRELVTWMSTEERSQIIDAYCTPRTNRRHKPRRAFENVYYTFDLCADYGVYRDLHRHRMITQERQDLGVKHGYITPPEILLAGLNEEYTQCMKAASDCYTQIAKEFPKEAQYVVPLAYRIRWYITCNLRQLYWLCELRSVPQGHQNYRRIVQKMYTDVKRVHPLLVKHMTFVDMNDYSLGRLTSEIEKEKRQMDLQHQ